MISPKNAMNENELSKVIVDSCLTIHKILGPGLFESVYEGVLFYELEKRNLKCTRQVKIPVVYQDIKMDAGFKADILVEDKVIIEIKSVDNIIPLHKKQVLTYLKLSGIKLGLLVNFNVELIRNGITRIVNNL
jgi:GxxExxY protein